MKAVKDTKAADDPAKVRENLLNAARQAGPRYLSVRGTDLETAITGQGQTEPVVPLPADNKATSGDKK